MPRAEIASTQAFHPVARQTGFLDNKATVKRLADQMKEGGLQRMTNQMR